MNTPSIKGYKLYKHEWPVNNPLIKIFSCILLHCLLTYFRNILAHLFSKLSVLFSVQSILPMLAHLFNKAQWPNLPIFEYQYFRIAISTLFNRRNLHLYIAIISVIKWLDSKIERLVNYGYTVYDTALRWSERPQNPIFRETFVNFAKREHSCHCMCLKIEFILHHPVFFSIKI